MTCQLQSPYPDWWRIIWFKKKLLIKLDLGLSIVAWNGQYCCHIWLVNGDERMATYKLQWHQLEVFKVFIMWKMINVVCMVCVILNDFMVISNVNNGTISLMAFMEHYVWEGDRSILLYVTILSMLNSWWSSKKGAAS